MISIRYINFLKPKKYFHISKIYYVLPIRISKSTVDLYAQASIDKIQKYKHHFVMKRFVFICYTRPTVKN